ncbi:MAG: hypothetical protein E7H60_01190 [Pseudomonas oryzihabitans]|uniref:hypothetical protein n=1 Tax=Pseudomonas oryzihabitans TaxID=47885 RepID=UPI002911F43B|nr:hypothetical protein [Pseudomonas oryzihabitans]MDU4055128.1 hypothetical protein [Pseudomonas oryzihabitans]
MNKEIFQTEARFICPHCDRPTTYQVYIPEPNWYAMEKLSDMYSEGPVFVNCTFCGTEFDAYAQVTNHECTIVFEDHLETKVDCDPPYYFQEEDWTNDSVPDHPLKIFESSISQIRDHLDKQNGELDRQFINRMLFCQAVTALEAFLGDFLQRNLTPNAIKNLISHELEIKREKFTLEQIHNNKNLVEQTVRIFLKGVLYHNIPKVANLYKIAFGIEALTPPIDMKKIMTAINLRHDCVHRNGFTTDGEWLDTFTNDYIQETLLSFSELVNHIFIKSTVVVAKEVLGDDF